MIRVTWYQADVYCRWTGKRLLPEPEKPRPVTGRFWSAGDGQAFLFLASEDGRDVVLPPGQPLRVRGSWERTQVADAEECPSYP